MKLCKSSYPDDRFHAWLFFCPGCRAPHQCDQRWEFNGDEASPTFVGSVLVRRNVGEEQVATVCHSYVRDGKIQFLGDCTHALVGQTVDLPDWDDRTAYAEI